MVKTITGACNTCGKVSRESRKFRTPLEWENFTYVSSPISAASLTHQGESGGPVAQGPVGIDKSAPGRRTVPVRWDAVLTMQITLW